MKLWSVFKIYLSLALILSAFLLGLVFLGLIEPTSIPQNIFFTNQTDHQATVSWTTSKPTRSLIIASKNGQFPLLPLSVFGQVMSKDDGEKLLFKQGFYTTHSVTTAPTTQDTPPLPQPIFGKITTQDGKPPQEAVVYVEIGNGTLLSSYTRADGNWLITLNNARTKNLSTYLTPQDQDRIAVTIQAGTEGFISKATTLAKRNELSSIILNKHSAPTKSSALPGDINGDGVINAFDLIFTVQKGSRIK